MPLVRCLLVLRIWIYGRFSRYTSFLVYGEYAMTGNEIGSLPITRQDANVFLQVVSQLYEDSQIIITSNESFDEWLEFTGDLVVTTAILDMLVRNGELFNIKGESNRFKNRNTIFDQKLASSLRHAEHCSGVSGIIKWRDWGCGQKPGLISQEVVHAFLRGTNEGSPTVHQV